MHVAINALFSHRPDTGSGQYLLQLVRHLAEQVPDLRLTLVHPGSAAPPDGLPSSCHWHPVGARPGNLGKLLFEQLSFPRACRRLGADLAHVPYWGSPLRSPVPVVVTVHDLIPLVLPRYRGGLLTRLYTSLVAASARGARQIITDSNASKADIVTRLGAPAEQVAAIHLAADDRFQPGPRDPAAAARYGLPEDYVLYLGSLDVRKNVRTLLHAYSYVGPAIGDQYPLVIAGRLPKRPTLRFPDLGRLVAELGIQPYVRLVGLVDEADKPAIIRGAKVLVQLSHYEGFGLTPLEAMACGTPVVVSNRSSLPEVVGSAGFVVEPDDGRGAAGAIIACATQSGLHADLRQRGLKQAARFTWRATAEQTWHIYRQALAESG